METLPIWFGGLLAILLLSAFVKVATTLSILRFGLGLDGAGFGIATLLLALALSALVISPQLDKSGGLESLLNGRLALDRSALERDFRPFVLRNAEPELLARLNALSERLRGNKSQASADKPSSADSKTAAAASDGSKSSFSVEVSAFLITQLKQAFQLGFLFIVPFLFIDLVVANALLALGVQEFRQALIAVPLKLLFFVAVGGWQLIAEKLVSSFIP